MILETQYTLYTNYYKAVQRILAAAHLGHRLDCAGVASERAFSDGSTASRGAFLASDTTLDWAFRSGTDTATWN